MKKSSRPNYKSAVEGHVFHVYHDPDFINDISNLGRTVSDMTAYESIANKYCITKDEAFRFHFAISAGNVSDVPILPRPNYSLKHESVSKKFIIEVGDTINKTELEEVWAQLEMHRTAVVVGNDLRELHNRLGGETKRKPPQETDLIYALFKARMKYSPNEIFRLYHRGELGNYSGSSTQFSTQKSLDAYYNKYRPDR